MFNLLVRQGHPSRFSWQESGTCSFELERLHELRDYSAPVAKYYENIELRRELPCLFSYEGTNEYGRIGSISRIAQSGSDVKIAYSLDVRFPPIPIHDDETYRKFGCSRGAQGRRQWTVKNIDLFETVLEVLASQFSISATNASGQRMDELWGYASVHYARVFLSHRDKDKGPASVVAEGLEKLGHKTFVAHNDIAVTKEWRDEILYALNTMTHFVGLITDDFHEGSWTDQEMGYAFARSDVKRIFIKLSDCDPRGFGNFEQAAKSDWASAARRIGELMDDR